MRHLSRLIAPCLLAPCLLTPCLLVMALIAGTLSALPPALAHDTGHGTIAIDQPWTRATPPAARAAGGFVTIHNTGADDDRLVGATSPLGTVEIHTMDMKDGVMRMRHLPDGLAVPAGGTVMLKPGGDHLMFLGLSEPVVEGMPIPVTLRFEKAGEVMVELEVAPIGARAPKGMDAGDMKHDGMKHQGTKHE